MKNITDLTILFCLTFILLIQLPVDASKTGYPVIKSWRDVEKNIPSGEKIVSVISPKWFILYGRGSLIEDSTSLTGQCAVQPSGEGDWYVNCSLVYGPVVVDPDKYHTVYVLVKAKKHGNDGIAFGWGTCPDTNAKELQGPVPASLLRNDTWQLVKFGKSSLRGDLFLSAQSNVANIPFVYVGAVILTSDYEPNPQIKEYLTPNGDGLNDEAVISFPAPLDKNVKVSILDTKGQAVKLLADQSFKTPIVSVAWNGKNAQGQICPEEKYTVRIVVDNHAREFPNAIFLEHIAPWKPLAVNKPDFFPIGVCVEGENGVMSPSFSKDENGIKAFYEKVFSDLHKNGFNTVCLFKATFQHAPMILEMAEKYDLKIILAIDEMCGMGYSDKPISEKVVYNRIKAVTDKLSKYPSLLRYLIVDEPTERLTDTWLTLQRIQNNVDPQHPVFSVTNTVTVIDSLMKRTVMSEVIPDIYLIRPGASPMYLLNNYAENVGIIVKASENRPVWAMPQAFFGGGPWRMPTNPEIRSLTWLSLAKGAKGYIYFLYNDVPPMKGIVDEKLQPRPIHNEVSAVATIIRKIAPVLLDLQLKDIGIKAADVNVHEVGQFQDKNKNTYFIVVSKDPEKDTTAVITLPAEGKFTRAADLVTGIQIPVKNRKLSCALRPGDGVLLKLE
jgi:hypothetical protein